METSYAIYAQDSPESVTRTLVAEYDTHLEALTTFTNILLGGGTCIGCPYIILEKIVRSYGNNPYIHSTRLAGGYLPILDDSDEDE